MNSITNWITQIKNFVQRISFKLTSYLTSKLTPSQLQIGAIALLIVAVLFVLFPPLSIENGALTWADWTGLGEDVDVSVVNGEIEQNGNQFTLKRVTIEQPASGTTFVDWINSLGAPFALTVLGFGFRRSRKNVLKSRQNAKNKLPRTICVRKHYKVI